MVKKNRIYEKKTNQKKTKSISIRTTEESAATIDKKAEQAGLNRNDYICTACEKCEIIVIPEGQEILQTVQETRNLLRSSCGDAILKSKANKILGEVVLLVRNSLLKNAEL